MTSSPVVYSLVALSLIACSPEERAKSGGSGGAAGQAGSAGAGASAGSENGGSQNGGAAGSSGGSGADGGVSGGAGVGGTTNGGSAGTGATGGGGAGGSSAGTGGDAGSTAGGSSAGGSSASPCQGASDGDACGMNQICLSGSCVISKCGDGFRDPRRNEVCDDRTNAGQVAGDCSTDCLAIVQKKLIRLSQTAAPTSFAKGKPNPIAEADSFCPVGYKAMIADGSRRVASVGPFLGNGQVDWVLKEWTQYVNAADETIWTTTKKTLLGVDDSNQWVGLRHSIDPGAASAVVTHTGIHQDWTTAPLNCVLWTSDLGLGSGGPNDRESGGRPQLTTQEAIGVMTGSGLLCGSNRPFYCVEQ